MVAMVNLVAVVSTVVFALDDYAIHETLWGGDGVNLYIAAYGRIIIGSTLAILPGMIGYHRVHLTLGPSLFAIRPDEKIAPAMYQNTL